MRGNPLVFGEDALVVPNNGGSGQILRGAAGKVSRLGAGRVEYGGTNTNWAHDQ
jgi:hypothetical protein